MRGQKPIGHERETEPRDAMPWQRFYPGLTIPDAWPRFERFIREVVKTGPQHRETTKSKRRRASPRTAPD
jgi:hypothetical protein